MEVGCHVGQVHQEEGRKIGESSGRGVDWGNLMTLGAVGRPGQPDSQAAADIFVVSQVTVDQG